MIAQEDIKTDFFKMLKARAFSVYSAYYMPCGAVDTQWDTIRDLHLEIKLDENYKSGGPIVHCKQLSKKYSINNFAKGLYHIVFKVRSTVFEKENIPFVKAWNENIVDPQIRNDIERRD